MSFKRHCRADKETFPKLYRTQYAKIPSYGWFIEDGSYIIFMYILFINQKKYNIRDEEFLLMISSQLILEWQLMKF